MSRAEERALEAYPIAMSEYSDNCMPYDSNESERLTFVEGYRQAEKDLELTWKDIETIVDKLSTHVFQDGFNYYTREYYEEILKIFKKAKNKIKDS